MAGVLAGWRMQLLLRQPWLRQPCGWCEALWAPHVPWISTASAPCHLPIRLLPCFPAPRLPAQLEALPNLFSRDAPFDLWQAKAASGRLFHKGAQALVRLDAAPIYVSRCCTTSCAPQGGPAWQQ